MSRYHHLNNYKSREKSSMIIYNDGQIKSFIKRLIRERKARKLMFDGQELCGYPFCTDDSVRRAGRAVGRAVAQ